MHSATIKSQTESKKYKKELEEFDNITALYFTLYSAVKKPYPGKEKGPSRLFYSKTYLLPIVNTFHGIRILFDAGLHSQLQILLRTQIEFVNALIAFTADKDYFDYFTKSIDSVPTLSNTKTQKLTNADKAIRKMIAERYPDISASLWRSYLTLRTDLYSDLSETAHGNFSRVILQSMDFHKEINFVLPALGGHEIPSEFTLSIFKDATRYFQFTFKFIYENLFALDFINNKEKWFKYLDQTRTQYVFGPAST